MEIFQSTGTMPEERDELNRAARWSEMEEQQSFSILAEMPSGPEEVSDFSLVMA